MSLAHLALGTASWSTVAPYYNNRVAPSDAELRHILDVAELGGVRWIDTAVAYGDAEARLARCRAWNRFKIVTKVKPDVQPLFMQVTAVLAHLGPRDAVELPKLAGGFVGASVYTPEQAMAALDQQAQVLQVPWNQASGVAKIHKGEIVDAWELVRDRAYADGVLFFGRQPFARGDLAPPWDGARKAFEWALTSNPRGWCVVGVETADQLRELLAWRDALT